MVSGARQLQEQEQIDDDEVTGHTTDAVRKEATDAVREEGTDAVREEATHLSILGCARTSQIDWIRMTPWSVRTYVTVRPHPRNQLLRLCVTESV